MNENLLERFTRNKHGARGGANHHNNSNSSGDKQKADIWVLPQKLNPRVREYYQATRKPADSGPWVDRPELPTSAEILDLDGEGSTSSEIVEIVPNKPQGAWESKDAYLGAHYELLREDALRSLREAICQIRKNPQANEDAFKNSVGIYQDVYVTAVVCSTRGIALRVTFSTFRAQKKILWEQSKRLISGSLVVLTPATDMFQKKGIVATVAARPLEALAQNPPEIDLFIARSQDLEIDPGLKMAMVEERSAYYEADRHILLAMQKMAGESFPLAEHLVEAQSQVSAPTYLQEKSTLNMTPVFVNNKHDTYDNIDVLRAWPSQPEGPLDKSQTAALRRMLTKKLAIVQGPPGTGKTFVSVQALGVMLANWKRGDPPIIITCQTNHALDQLLRHIAKLEPESFVRLGGRSKDKDDIKKRTLYEVRNSQSDNALPGSLAPSAKKKMRDIEKDITAILSPLKPDLKSTLDHRLFVKLGLLTKDQADSLEAGASQWVQAEQSDPNKAARSPFTVWLGRALEIVPRPGEDQEFGFDLEEVDLEYEQLTEIEAENFAKDDEEFEGLRGNSYSLADNFTGRKVTGMKPQKLKDLLKEKDMWRMPENLRGAIYRYLQTEAKLRLRDSFREKAKVYDEQARLRRIGLWEKDETILRQQKVIGMTTTGFSKYRGLVAALQPKVVLIEEAAETLEAPVTVTCVPSLQQLVLVGDHKQLRPHCNVRAHEDRPFYLNISLFERLVKNGVEFDTLTKQRRMIPEVRRILYPIYKDIIQDHGSVKNPANRPNVPGMGGVNSFFFTHLWPETRDDQMSCVKIDEAEMIVGFVEYLVYNGMETEDITVLTFYNGQRKRILGNLRKLPTLQDRRFNVVTVDSYQGEENKVVILSLVRSNDKNQIGFLEVENRVCVALSRAQNGFYMFGNGQILFKVNKIWEKVITILGGGFGKKVEKPPTEPMRRLAETLPVRCKKHGELTEIKDARDWQNIVGGCAKKCDEPLECGHMCELTCHPFGHDLVPCQQPCVRLLACKHKCSGVCSDKNCRCDKCTKPLSAQRMIIDGPHKRFDGKEQLALEHSSDSSQSWKSFAKDEPIRYAAARSTPVSHQGSPAKHVRGESLIDFSNDGDVIKPMEATSLGMDGHASAPLSVRSTPVSGQQKGGEQGRFMWVDEVSTGGGKMPGQFPGMETSLLD